MPRAGSSSPPGGPVPAAPMSIGEVADPPFAVIADPAVLFARRAARLRALAERDDGLAPYLLFLAEVAGAQGRALEGLAPPLPPGDRVLDLAREHGMPPLGRVDVAADPAAIAAFDALVRELAGVDVPAAAGVVLDALRTADPGARIELLAAVRDGEDAAADVAARVFAAAALQIHFSRLAATLDPESLRRITDGACPACGETVAASTVVTWEGAANTRFCACATCGTQWHVPRVRCLACGGEKDVTFMAVEGGPEAVKAESCRACRAYVKIAYQTKDRDVEPVADDVASLALDMLMTREGYRRAGRNPFLSGH